jgi:methylamine dehydrogenase accessory protein MauD
MDILVVSNIVLWIAFVAMVVVNVALARQIGVLYERIAPAGALMMNQKLEVGMTSPVLSLPDLNAISTELGRGVAGKSQLIFFLSPDCPVCGSILPALLSAAKAEGKWLDLILASDGEEQNHTGYVSQKGLSNFPYIVSEQLGKTFGVSKLPYAVLIDEKGVIASLGIINSREHLDSLFEAKEKSVASIQDFMARKRSSVQYHEADK